MDIVNETGRPHTLAPYAKVLKGYLHCPTVEIQPCVGLARGDWFEIACDTRPRIRFLGVRRKYAPVEEQVRHLAIEAEQLRRGRKRELLFLAPFIGEDRAKALREAGIFYVDGVGNAYLELEAPRVLVDVGGKRPDTAPRAEPGRLVEPTGLKVIHLLLTRKDALNAPYRKIAADAGVALGTVAVVMRELENAGYLVATAADRRALEKRADLIEHFVRGYALKLWPAIFLGRYRHAEKDPWKLCEALTLPLQTRQVPYALTGAWAARERTGHLRADTLTLHVGEGAFAVWKGQPMLLDPVGGNVQLLKCFAPTVIDPEVEGKRERPLATALLTYAELLRDGRPREVETAQVLYDRFLRPK
jgi:hypothetical protein